MAATAAPDTTLREVWSYTVAPLAPHTLGLLPSASTGVNKVCVGDSSGVLHCLGIKRGKIAPLFATPKGTAISRVTVVKDKIFIASSTEVRGFSKKGRNFYNISTFMTENIRSMFIHEKELHLAGDRLYCNYIDNIEQPYFVSQHSVLDMCPITHSQFTDGNKNSAALLACSDRALRVVVGNVVERNFPLDVCPTTLCVLGDTNVAYGTSCGRVGEIVVEHDSHSLLWLSENPLKLGAVTAVAVCPTGAAVDGTAQSELLVGHDCGAVQILATDEGNVVPRTLVRLGSAVTGVAVGPISTVELPDIVVATYSGTVSGFQVCDVQSDGTALSAKSFTDRLAAAAAEVASLEASLKSTRTAHADLKAESLEGGLTKLPVQTVIGAEIRDSFVLDDTSAAHILTLELAVSIDVVVLRCSVPGSITVSPESGAVATCRTATAMGIGLVMCFTCKPGTTRLQFIVRVHEGQSGMLEANIMPHQRPKTCCRRKYQICALSLHQATGTALDESLPLSEVTMQGPFGANTFHAWLSLCLPGLAPHVSAMRTVIVYRSTLLSTQVEAAYEDGAATLRSHSLSTLAILRDTISKEATLASVQVKLSSKPNHLSAFQCLQLVAPKFEFYRRMAQRHHMSEPLKELMAHEENGDFLTDDQRSLLNHADSVSLEHTHYPYHLERLHDMVTRLFTDTCTFFRRNPKSGQEKLSTFLEDNFSLEEVLELFKLHALS